MRTAHAGGGAKVQPATAIAGGLAGPESAGICMQQIDSMHHDSLHSARAGSPISFCGCSPCLSALDGLHSGAQPARFVVGVNGGFGCDDSIDLPILTLYLDLPVCPADVGASHEVRQEVLVPRARQGHGRRWACTHHQGARRAACARSHGLPAGKRGVGAVAQRPELLLGLGVREFSDIAHHYRK